MPALGKIGKHFMGMDSVLNRIIAMFGGNKVRENKAAARDVQTTTQSGQNDAFARLNAVAPLASEIKGLSSHGAVNPVSREESEANRSIVCREAVLGKDQRVAGYAFSLRYEVNQRVRASSTNVQRLYDKVLLSNLQVMEIQRLLEHRLAFIDIAASSLDMPLLETFQPRNIVYVVGTNEQLAANPESCLSSLVHLKKLGYRIGLYGAGVDNPVISPFVDLAEFLFVDMAANDIPTIKNQVNAVARQAPSIKFVATNVQTLEEFGVCDKLPFSYYQGAFITNRERWDTPRMDAGRIKILELLNKLRGDAEIAELTTLIKQDPALSFKLLRYINSPGMGLTHKIGTLDQALIVLGQQKLYRWLTLLLFTSGNVRGLDWAIMENALVRARFAELVAQDALSSNERDELFVAGVFSLLDIVLATPMKDVLKQVNLPPLVNDVLLNHGGKYAPYLDLAIACELSDDSNIDVLSQKIGLDSKEVNSLHAEALVWAQQIGE